MIRWTYLLPRLILVALLLAGLRWGVSPLAKRLVVSGGQSFTGARVDVDWMRTQLDRTAVEMGRTQIANPDKPMENSVEFSAATLRLDRQALLRRRFVVERGSIKGVRFDTPRETSGELGDAADRKAEDDANQQINSKLREWTDQWANELEQRLRNDLESEFQSVRLARELNQRWPREYERVMEDGVIFKAKIMRLKRIAESPKEHLRGLRDYNQLRLELDDIRREIPIWQQRLHALRQQVTKDKQAIQQARVHDEAVLREKLAWKGTNAQKMTDYLLGPTIQRQLSVAQGWADRVGQLLSAVSGKPGINQTQGRGITFDFGPRQPSIWLQKLEIDGQFGQGSSARSFHGMLYDASNDPTLCKEPTRMRIDLTGKAPMKIVATLDRREAVTHRAIQIRMDDFRWPSTTLGQDQRLAWKVETEPGLAWIELHWIGDKLDGRIVIDQPNVQIQPQVGESLGGAATAHRLAQTTQHVKKLQLEARLHHSDGNPHWKLRSNLGEAISNGTNQALQAELAAQSQRVKQLAQQKIASELVQLEQYMVAQEDQVAELINQFSDQLSSIRQSLLSASRFPIGSLDSKIWR